MASSNQPSQLDAIVKGLNTDKPQPVALDSSNVPESIWEEFQSVLENPPGDVKGRMHSIDADLLDTLNQCDFDVSLNRVINGMIRTFIKVHIDRLREMRQKTLFETV